MSSSKDSSKPRTPPRPGRTARRRRAVHALLLFVSAVLIVDLLVGEKGLLDIRRARQEYDQLASAIARLRRENAALREEARRLREDPRAVEDLARRELGLVRSGEVLVIVKDIPSPAPRRPR